MEKAFNCYKLGNGAILISCLFPNVVVVAQLGNEEIGIIYNVEKIYPFDQFYQTKKLANIFNRSLKKH